MRRPRILLSAGEASGDRLGGGLAAALLARRPDLELLGMGGPRMAEAGVRLIQDASEVSVVGIWEVLGHLPALRRAMARLARAVEEEAPDLVVPIDFPDFNLRFAARARRRGVDVVYFVSPQVWAWRRGRVRVLKRLVRRMLVLFPFEVSFYEAAGVPVTFVGHPVAEREAPRRSRSELAALVGLDPGREVVALLPGSRRGEVDRLLPPLLDAAAIVSARRPGTQWLIPVAGGLSDASFETARQRLDSLRLHRGDFPELLSIAAAGAVASGTASLEAAVTGLPLVVVYRMSAASYWIGRALVRLDHIALPNLVAGERVVPELIQGACTGERIAEVLLGYLERPEEAERVRQRLRGVRERLGGPGVFERAADAVLGVLDSARAGVC